jgi:DHA1 family bicyclomycin/chloramphenicol resistance-like MFS transporter
MNNHGSDVVIRNTKGYEVRLRRVSLALVLGSLAAFGPLSIDMYLPSFPALAEDFHAGTSLVQLSLTACLLGLSCGQLVAGSISDVCGRRRPLMVGLAVYAAVSLLCAFSPSIWALIALRFLQGMAGGAGIVISRAVVRDLFSGAELTKFFTLLMLVNGSAPIFAPLVGGQILRVTSWPGVFVLLAAVGVIMLIVVYFGLPETLEAERRSAGGLKNTLLTFRRLIFDREFMGYALAQGFVAAGIFSYVSGSPFVIQDIYGASPQMFSLLFAVNGVGLITAGQITGRLAARIGEAKLLHFGLGLAAFGGVSTLLTILSGAGLYMLMPCLFMVVSSIGIVGSTSFALAMQNQAKSAGSAAALLGLISFVAGGCTAPLVGLGGSHTAIPMGVVIASADVGAVLCYYFLTRGGGRRA